jgi:hypothetical protein
MDFSYIIIPILALITSQALKLATDGIKGNFNLKSMLISYGGMPSSHTAFTVSITTLIGLRIGFDNAIFALALIFTLIIMRDAAGFRNILGQQAKAFNRFIDHLPPDEKAGIPHFREQIGHSTLEIAAGAAWGIILTYFLSLL